MHRLESRMQLPMCLIWRGVGVKTRYWVGEARWLHPYCAEGMCRPLFLVKSWTAKHMEDGRGKVHQKSQPLQDLKSCLTIPEGSEFLPENPRPGVAPHREDHAEGPRNLKQDGFCQLHSWKLTWKPKRGPIKTTVTLKWGYMGFHVSLGECRVQGLGLRAWGLQLYSKSGQEWSCLSVFLNTLMSSIPFPTDAGRTTASVVCREPHGGERIAQDLCGVGLAVIVCKQAQTAG